MAAEYSHICVQLDKLSDPGARLDFLSVPSGPRCSLGGSIECPPPLSGGERGGKEGT